MFTSPGRGSSLPRPPFCFARPHHLLLSPFSLLPSRVSSTDPSLRGILVTRASAPPSPSIVHPRDPSSSSSSSPSSTFFSFSRRFRFEIFNEKEGIEWNERFDSSCNVRHNVRGEAYGQWEWRRVEKPVAGIERTLLRLVHEYKADDRWPLADSPLGWIVDIGQSESRFTEGGAPLFRKRQNWFVQFSPLYDRGLAGREWTQKEERERERGPPGPPGGEALRRSLFRASPVYRSALPASPPILLVRGLAFLPSATIRRYRYRYRYNVGIARSRSLPESNGTSRRDWGGRGRMDGKGWKEFEAPSKAVVTSLFTLSSLPGTRV